MRYKEWINLNPAVGGIPVTHVFSANGLYDPSITGVGHQPRYFDQLMALYDHYTVIGSKITVYCQNTDTDQAQFVHIWLSDNNTTSTSRTDHYEAPTAKHLLLGPAGSGTDTRQMSMSVNPNAFLGRPDPLDEDSLRGNIASNPSEQAFFHVVAESISNTDPSAIDIVVLIEYQAVLTEPKLPGES